MKTLIVFIALLTMTVLVGCKLKVPAFDSATVEVNSGGRLIASGVLADAQVMRVKEWLAARETGWEHRIESTGPALLVKLERQGKVVVTMNIMQQQVKVGDYFLRITSDEEEMLRQLLTPFLNSKQAG